MENNQVVNTLVENDTKEIKTETAITSQKLLIAGAHFGHQKSHWNPKMKKFIYTTKKGIHIIDLSKTIARMENTYNFVKELSAANGEFLFVGTKKQAKDIIKAQAQRCGAFYVEQRWLGGTLTNFRTINQRFRRMLEIERMDEDGIFNKLSKKEVITLKKEYSKLDLALSGIRKMRYMPKAIFIADPTMEMAAVLEAKKLKIPVIAIVDTNANPDLIDFPIPANDDAMKSLELITTIIADAINEGKGLIPILAYTKDEKIIFERKPRQERSYDRHLGGRYHQDFKEKHKHHERNNYNNFDSRRYDNKKEYVNRNPKHDFVSHNDNYRKYVVNHDSISQNNQQNILKPSPSPSPSISLAKKNDQILKIKANPTIMPMKKTTSTIANDAKSIDSYTMMKLVELKAVAKLQGIKGYSTLRKTDLITLLKGE